MSTSRSVVLACVAAAVLGACAQAGTPLPDSGTGHDSGNNNPDTMMPHDTGTVIDTGTHTDTGTHNDTATGNDTIFVIDTGSTTHDSGTTRRDSGFMVNDTGTNPGGSTPLFGHCTQDSDCAMGGCFTASPVPYCTQGCMSSADCGSSGQCLVQGSQGICLPTCTSGGGECDMFGGACAPLDATNFACLPSCFVTSPPAGDQATCPSGAACELYSGACGAMPPTSGADDGSACTADTDCKGGFCFLPTDAMTGNATGFLGGYCLSYGRQADPSEFSVGAPVPQANCPTGSAPYPVGNTGDQVPCFKTCTTDTDCRAGYSCQLAGSASSGQTSNGWCAPIDCSMSGMTCPSGTTCMMMGSGTMTYGVCG